LNKPLTADLLLALGNATKVGVLQTRISGLWLASASKG
jgi:hypothetical protein